MATTVKSLSILQKQQFLKGNAKGQLLGNIIGIVYFWIFEVVIFFVLRSEKMEAPALAVAVILLSCVIADFLFKLIMEKDNSVMDSFLKSRPVSEDVWNRFLALSQFWKLSNLILPLVLLPACFLFLPFLYGVPAFAGTYLASVFNGFVVMRIKHRGPYQAENASKSHFGGAVASGRGNYIFGLFPRAFKRSRRLRLCTVLIAISMYFQFLAQSMSDRMGFCYFCCLLFFFISCTIPQNAFAVEANFFNGIWTRPLMLERMLEDKFRISVITGAACLMFCLPVCIWTEVAVLDLVSIMLYVSFFCSLAVFIDAYDCPPINLFENTFYNKKKGNSANFKFVPTVVFFIVIGIGWACLALLSGWKSRVILSAFGIAGLAAHKTYFKWLVRRFMAKRYEIMEKYNS